MNKKKLIVFISVFIVALGLIIGGVILVKQPTNKFVEKPKEDEKYKPKKTLLKDIEHEQLKITNIDIKKIDNHYEFIFTITNTSDKATYVQIINYVFYDEKGNEVGRIENELQSVIPGQPTEYVLLSSDEKLFKASEIKIELSPLIIE